MVDERQRVIRQLLLRLEESGIAPERGFMADFIPGRGWTFSQSDDSETERFASGSSPSSLREVRDALPPPIRPIQK